MSTEAIALVAITVVFVATLAFLLLRGWNPPGRASASVESPWITARVDLEEMRETRGGADATL